MGARYVTLYIFTSTSGETAAQAKEVIDSMLYDRFQGDTDAISPRPWRSRPTSSTP